MSSTTAERLQLLQEHIRLSVLERKRSLAAGAEPSSRTAHEISRSLDTLNQGIAQLEDGVRRLERAQELPADAVQEQRDELAALRSKHDDLQAQFAAQSRMSNIESGDLLIDLAPHSRHSFDESAARDALMGSRESPDTLRRSNKTVRFRDSLVDTEEMENQQVLQLHERVMEEQDESLDRLSQSIHSQRELSIQIGDELDDHVRLLDGVDELVDRHQSRLEGAKKRLNHVARTARDHGSLMVIAILIIILVLLIIILK